MMCWSFRIRVKIFWVSLISISPSNYLLYNVLTHILVPQLVLLHVSNNVNCWTMRSSKYIRGALQNIESTLKKKFNVSLPKQDKNPLLIGYRPEVDVTPELDDDLANYYQSLIGIAVWIVELGRIDIATETYMLSSHLAIPRRGHLTAVLHLFSYLKPKHNATLAFDPKYPVIEQSIFSTNDWTRFYGNV